MSKTIPDFKLSGKFSKGNATRWLKAIKADFKREGIDLTPSNFLDAIYIQLDGEAADWADSNPTILRILEDSQDATVAQQQLVEDSLKARFSSAITDQATDAQAELDNFEQNKEESLTSYYQRAVTLLTTFTIRDPCPRSAPLTILETTILKKIIKSYVVGLQDVALRNECAAAIVSSSLRDTHEKVLASQEVIGIRERFQADQTIKNKLKLYDDEKERQKKARV
jgi:hypothetical protein